MSRQLVLDLPLRTALGREDFLVTPSNAAAVAYVSAKPGKGAPLYGVAIHSNIVTASLTAVVSAVNRALARGREE